MPTVRVHKCLVEECVNQGDVVILEIKGQGEESGSNQIVAHVIAQNEKDEVTLSSLNDGDCFSVEFPDSMPLSEVNKLIGPRLRIVKLLPSDTIDIAIQWREP